MTKTKKTTKKSDYSKLLIMLFKIFVMCIVLYIFEVEAQEYGGFPTYIGGPPVFLPPHNGGVLAFYNPTGNGFFNMRNRFPFARRRLSLKGESRT